MTTLLSTYSFMDLLKDNNYVPKTVHSKNENISTFADAFKKYASNYGFMDLLHDKGYVPSMDNTLLVASNDNEFIWREAS